MQLLQARPHPHIIEPIDIDQSERIYLRKYRHQAANMLSAQSQRIKLYHDIVDALRHLHSFGIVHADIRIDNILFDDDGSAILCDFSAASPCGQPNPAFPDLSLPINGPSPTLSEAPDMFAMASLIFQMEHGAAPELSLENGTLVLPEIRSGNQGIDEVIRKAWLGSYSNTSEMLQQLAFIDPKYATAMKVLDPFLILMAFLKNKLKDGRITEKGILVILLPLAKLRAIHAGG